MTIGRKIKSLRISLGLTQEELATAVGTKKQTIHKYETGIISNIPASKIKAMADKLKTTPAYLMGWEDETEKKNNTTTSEPDELSQKEKQLFYNKYQLLNDLGKAKVESYIDDLLVNPQYRNKIIPERESSYSIAAWGGDETETTQPPIDEITT